MTAPTCRRHPDVEMVIVEEGTLNGVEVRYYGCPTSTVDSRNCRAHSPARWFDDPLTPDQASACGCVTRHCNTVERVDEPVGVQADLFGGDT